MSQTDDATRMAAGDPEAAEPAVDAVAAEVPRPEGARAQLLETDTTTTILIPPQGYRGMVRQMLVFAIGWNLMLGAMTVIVVASAVSGGVKDAGWGGGAMVAGFAALFWGVGIASALGTVNAARRECVWVATAGELAFTQKGPLGSKELAWARERIAAVFVGPSGTSINDVPVLNLQVHTTDGGHKGVLGGYSERELYWIAGALRRRLGVPGR